MGQWKGRLDRMGIGTGYALWYKKDAARLHLQAARQLGRQAQRFRNAWDSAFTKAAACWGRGKGWSFCSGSSSPQPINKVPRAVSEGPQSL